MTFPTINNVYETEPLPLVMLDHIYDITDVTTKEILEDYIFLKNKAFESNNFIMRVYDGGFVITPVRGLGGFLLVRAEKHTNPST